jgi:integrase
MGCPGQGVRHLAWLDRDRGLAGYLAVPRPADDAWQETGLVFTTAYGTPYEPRNFARHFTLRCSKASVRAIRVHDTRRTCASLLVALNVHPRVAMQILRHSQITVTMEIYSEVPSEATQDALKRLGDSLDG